jgi:tetratricopeptide (TPR) repeat protein
LPFIFLSGCKVLKDSKIALYYHNLVSHYNILFNANETYKTVVKATEDANVDNYNGILDVYQFGDNSILKNNSSSVDNILKKCAKIIDKHGESKWVDDSYFLIARSYFYKGDFYAAIEAFQYLTTAYPNSHVAFESMIWIALCNIKLQKYDDAEAMTSMSNSESKFPSSLHKELWLTNAYVKIKKGNYLSAIDFLKKAIPKENKKRYKTRYMFILAQLYQKTGQLPLAAQYFNDVIKRNPVYDMAFNAKIEISRCYPIKTEGDARYLKKQLIQMLKDDKNIQYRDQIYFELALIELKLKNNKKAEEYLQKSIENSQGNQNQKAIAYMLLADYYFQQKQFALSKKYYDSTAVSLNKDYPDYQSVTAQNSLKSELLEHLVTIETEDSLKKLAALKPSSRDSLINIVYQNELKQQRQLEEKQRSQKLQENQEMDFNRQVLNRDRSMMSMPGEDNSWYFSNPSTVQMGQSEFYLKWGKRVLEDDWRRKKKDGNLQSTLTDKDTSTIKKQEEFVISETDKQVLNDYLSRIPKEKQKYYQNIPITQGMLDISNNKIIEALKSAGDIYAERMRDTVNAILTFEDLLKRYPDNKYHVEAHYKLYNLYTAQKKPDKAQPHKDYILNNFPNSEYALLLNDPEAFSRLQNQKSNEAESFYALAFNLFQADSCSQLIPLIASNKSKYPFQYQAKLEFLSVVCKGKNEPKDDFIKHLQQFMATYSNYEITKNAQVLLDYLTGKNEIESPKITKAKDSIIKKSRFVMDESATHYFFCLYPAKYAKVSELKIAFSDYNKQYFELAGLQITTMILNKEYQVLLVKQFMNKEKAQEYLEGLINDNNYISRIGLKPTDFYIITEKNFYILLEDQSMKVYDTFFQKNYGE